MLFDDLNEQSFMMYAIKSYNGKSCVMSEFEDDLKRIKYVKRLIKRYKTKNELKERLILNHIIVMSNVFGIEATVRMLFYKLPRDDYPAIKPFLMFLSYLPKYVIGIRGESIRTSDILVDMNIAQKLREI